MNAFGYSKDAKKRVDQVGGYTVPATGAYDFTLLKMYTHRTEKGALAANIVFKDKDDKEVKFVIYPCWVVKDKNGVPLMGEDGLPQITNTRVNQQGETEYISDFVLLDELAIVTTGKPIAELESTEQSLSVKRNGADTHITVNMYTDMSNNPVKACTQRVITNGSQKNAKGEYVKNNDKRTQNTLVKVLHEDGSTVHEKSEGIEPVFLKEWLNRFDGKDRNDFKPVDGASSDADGGDSSATTSATSGKPLF